MRMPNRNDFRAIGEMPRYFFLGFWHLARKSWLYRLYWMAWLSSEVDMFMHTKLATRCGLACLGFCLGAAIFWLFRMQGEFRGHKERMKELEDDKARCKWWYNECTRLKEAAEVASRTFTDGDLWDQYENAAKRFKMETDAFVTKYAEYLKPVVYPSIKK